MELIINNYLIDAPIIDILTKCKKGLTNNKLKSIIEKEDWVSVTCPFHSDGIESHNSCGIVNNIHSSRVYGSYHCFTCNSKGSLAKFIGACFDRDEEFGEEWLVKNFGKTMISSQIDFPKWEVKKEIKKETKTLDESILDTFQNWHPYMAQRKLTKDVIDKFKIKYDSNTRSIVFPVWDENDNLVFLTRRSVLNKTFIIDKDVKKPIYLLNYVLKENYKYVVICESQINALTCWSKGIPAVALFGTGYKYQYDILNKSNILGYYLAFDGDEAGDEGKERFINNIRKDVFIEVLDIPRNKDVNDLTDEEFEKCFKKLLKEKDEN